MRTWGMSAVLALSLVGCVANPPQGDSDAHRERLQKKMTQRLNAIEGDPQLLHQVNEYALARVVRCQRCHEPEGRSKTPDMPFLAGQNPYYTLEQFQRYAGGRRQDFIMRTLAAGMADEDMINIAIYYARMPIRPAGGGTVQERALGEGLYQEKCASCHGTDGRGKETFPSLAGQQPKYVLRMLRYYRSGAEGGANNPVMTPIATGLTEKQMMLLAFYVANLH